jgi:hypothetical protein
MPPYTELPRPEGHIYFPYSPMSPPNWDIVASTIHVFVYRDVKLALQAMLQATTTIQAQRLEAGTASLFSDHLYFRGQSEVTQRLLPTRLRGPRKQPIPRERFSVDNPPKITWGGQEFPSRGFSGPPGLDPKDHFGDWYEEVEEMRVVEDSAAELQEGLSQCDAFERAAITRAAKISEVARLDDFQKRAAVRHYSGAPSALLDLSTNPEVAAFFATGGGAAQPPPAGQIGMLWAIDLNVLARLFSLEIAGVPNGLRITAREERHKWGDNKQMFEASGIQPTCLELTFVALPFRRPLAQNARFFSLRGNDDAPLPPLLTELTWWSIIERGACACAFLQDGQTYENASHNITRAALLPNDEELAIALA